MWRRLGIQADIAAQTLAPAMVWGGTRPGTPIRPGEQLFPRIDAGRPVPAAEPIGEVAEVPTKEASSVTVSFEEFQKLDLRVGRIVTAEPVPKADKLLKLTVDIGQEQRTVVAGIAESYRPEALVGKSIVLVANLAPRTLRGIESQGMVLAAESDGQIVLVSFDAAVNPGAKVK
jgi:methionyl-tRNA synthetase